MTTKTTLNAPNTDTPEGEARGTLTSPTGADGDSPTRQPSAITIPAPIGVTPDRGRRSTDTPSQPLPRSTSDTPMPTGAERLGPTGSPRTKRTSPPAPTPAVDVAMIRAVCGWLIRQGYKPVVRGMRITATRITRKE